MKEIGQLKGLKGWLFILGLVLIVSIINQITDTIIIFDYLNTSSTKSIGDNSGFNTLIFAKIFINLLLLPCFIYVAYLFFTKKVAFIKTFLFLAAAVVLANTIFIVITAFVVNTQNPALRDSLNTYKLKGLVDFFQNIIAATLWVLYLKRSLRVRNTFTK